MEINYARVKGGLPKKETKYICEHYEEQMKHFTTKKQKSDCFE